jgi:hypothetical protein
MLKQEKIKQIVNSRIASIEKPHIKKWFTDHIISPKIISIVDPLDSSKSQNYWLITDHNGIEDSGYRVVHSTEKECWFGMEMTTNKEESVFLGFYGDLNETLESI